MELALRGIKIQNHRRWLIHCMLTFTLHKRQRYRTVVNCSGLSVCFVQSQITDRENKL